MKLATFQVETVLGRFSRVGAVINDTMLLDLNAAYSWVLAQQGETQPKRLADVILPAHMKSLIEMGSCALEAARLVLDRFSDNPPVMTGIFGERLFFALDEIKLRTPLPDPGMLRDFLAFEEHTKSGFDRRHQTMPEAWYKIPVYYKGNNKSLIGPGDTVIWPRYTKKLDYELEVACIIGREGQNIDTADAHTFIFGYAILNDFSARDIQGEEMTCRLGPAKGKDFATALGPWIVTVDEVATPRNLRMQAFINGECWSDGNAGESHWSFEQMIAHVSMDETIYPGDIFGSGTVGGGCGLELNRWIQPGDIITLQIDGLGSLTNTIGS